jgi:signal peptidase I
MLGCLFEVLETLLLTLLIFLVVQVFVAQPYQVEQSSMENTLMPNQFVLVDKLTPRFSDYHRGDIIVFNPPAVWTGGKAGTPYIKRVIGVAGDTVDIHGGHVFVNGVELTESYVLDNQPTVVAAPGGQTWTLKHDQLFVMGDHRSVSEDSRAFGPIDESSVIGRALLRYWPLDKFGPLPAAKLPAIPNPSTAPAASSAATTPSAAPTPTKSAAPSAKKSPTASPKR